MPFSLSPKDPACSIAGNLSLFQPNVLDGFSILFSKLIHLTTCVQIIGYFVNYSFKFPCLSLSNSVVTSFLLLCASIAFVSILMKNGCGGPTTLMRACHLSYYTSTGVTVEFHGTACFFHFSCINKRGAITQLIIHFRLLS